MKSEYDKGDRLARRLVFISHAGTDTWIATQLSKAIGGAGVDTFLDESHIAIGEDFEERILAKLGEADELLVLLTPWSVKRPYVLAEIGAAAAHRIWISGVLYGLSINDVLGANGIPFMQRRNLITLTNSDVDRYIEELKARAS